MVDFTPPQYSLNAGIYGPALAQREDTEGYYSAVRDSLNVRPLVEGGVEARNGWGFAGHVRGEMTPIDLSSVSLTVGQGVQSQSSGSAAPPIVTVLQDPPPFPSDPFLPDFLENVMER